jgi:hypothetical protein
MEVWNILTSRCSETESNLRDLVRRMRKEIDRDEFELQDASNPY